MAWRCGSLSRSLISTARAPSIRSSTTSSLPRLRRPTPIPSRRRLLFTIPRTVEALGCAQSLLPLHSTVAAARLTSHISVEARAFCELSQGT